VSDTLLRRLVDAARRLQECHEEAVRSKRPDVADAAMDAGRSVARAIARCVANRPSQEPS